MEQFVRTERLLGTAAMEKLAGARVAIFGVGGVGGYTAEALARSGVGALDLIDDDLVCVSNINRQIIATFDTVGRPKADVMKERVLSINPQADVRVHRKFFLPENAAEFPFDEYDYVVDAVDTVAAKVQLAVICTEKHIPIMSSMGAGNKLDPTRFRVSDIFETSVDPLSRVMRTQLRKHGVRRLKVVWSDEIPVEPIETAVESAQALQPGSLRTGGGRRATPGSTAFTPSVAGLIIASEVLKDLTGGFARG